MTLIDYTIFALYMAVIIGIGIYFFKKNKNHEDYYVGGRDISSTHVGLFIAATDVGGGFSIGLGGVGYAIGLSGSWLLFTGLVGAWLSAVMSTADSCLMAAPGNFVNDLLEKMSFTRAQRERLEATKATTGGSGNPWKTKTHVLISQLVTLLIGAIAIVLALHFTTVLGGILHAYAFMVSGLTIPTLGAFFWKCSSAPGALAAMLAGGGLTLFILLTGIEPPFGLAPSFYGILLSAIVFIPISLLLPGKKS